MNDRQRAARRRELLEEIEQLRRLRDRTPPQRERRAGEQRLRRLIRLSI